MRSLALALVLVSSTASAESYVDAPAIGRSTTGVAIYGGTPLRGSHDVEGGGTEVHYGHTWDTGFSVAGVFGGARWSSMTEGYSGVSLRYVPGDAGVAPFLGTMFLLDYARMPESSAVGLATAARLGVRFREHPWDLFGAFEIRNTRLAGDDPLVITRLSIVIGAALEGPAQ